MIESIANINPQLFARFPKPKPSLLRRVENQSSRQGLVNGIVMMTVSSVEVVFSFDHPLVVTSSRPQATMGFEQSSVTSLNSQGRVVNI